MPNQSKVRITVDLSPEQHEKLRRFCFFATPRMSMQELIRKVVMQHIDAAKKPKK